MLNVTLNILANESGSFNIDANDIIDSINAQINTSSFTVIGVSTGSNFARGIPIFNSASYAISYSLTPQELGLITDRTHQTIIAKNGLKVETTYQNNNTIFNDVIFNGPYPFNIEVERSGSNYGNLKFSRYDGNLKAEITSSIILEAPYNYHFICQKTGSNLEMYIDGILIASGTDYSNIPLNTIGAISDTHNLCDLFIGQNGDGTKALRGSVDEIKISSLPLTSIQANVLANTELSGSYNYIVGNAYYEYGLLTITAPNSQYRQFIQQTPYNPQPTQSSNVLDGGINNQLIFTPVSGGFTASYYLYPPMSGGVSISGSVPYWPPPYEFYPTNNYVDGGYVSSSNDYILSQSYDGNLMD